MKTYPKWYYNEIRQVGIDFEKHEEVEGYDLHMQKIRDIKEEIRQALGDIGLCEGQTIMEIGTGTGELAIEASKHCEKVIALDVSNLMLESAKRKAEKDGRNNIEFKHAGFLTYEHSGEPLDAVVTQIALHHLPDTWKMIAIKRIYDMLRVGGKFYLKDLVYSFNIDNYAVYFENLVDANKIFYGDEAEKMAVAFIKDEYPTLSWIIEGMLERAGFNIDKVTHYEGFTSTYICTKRPSVR